MATSCRKHEVFLMIRRKHVTIFTDTDEISTILELKKIIEGILKAPPCNQRLFLEEEILEDDKTLLHYRLTGHTARAQNPMCLGLALRQENGEFEPLEMTPYSSPPELPDVVKETLGQWTE